LSLELEQLNAVVTSFHSPDVSDLVGYAPPDPERFSLLLEFTAAPDDGTLGGDGFGVVVCTPAWLADRVEAGRAFWPRHHLLVRSYDWPAIESFVVSYVRSCSGSGWEAVAQKIGRLAHWEFEDYRERP
jgi:Immunity protein 8